MPTRLASLVLAVLPSLGCASQPLDVESPRADATLVSIGTCSDSELAFAVSGAEVQGRILYVEIQDPGGHCEGTFSACWDPLTIDAQPPLKALHLRLADGPERCETLPSRRVIALRLDSTGYAVDSLGERSVTVSGPRDR